MMVTIWRSPDGKEEVAVECRPVDELMGYADDRFWSLYRCDLTPRRDSFRGERISQALKAGECLPLPEIVCTKGGLCMIEDGQRRIAEAKRLGRTQIPVIVHYQERVATRPVSCEDWERGK